jgi:Co/Zn/Cd efflux system component
MSAACCDARSQTGPPPAGYRRILVAALVINAVMFVVEIVSGAASNSSSLQADALDFLADAANYGISLIVLGAVLQRRAWAAVAKAVTMGLFGVWAIGQAIRIARAGIVPAATVMSLVGATALVANLLVAFLLYRYRHGDSNMRSVWLCTRNDALGNLAVVAAASGVFATGRGWPDVMVALAIASLALHGAWRVLNQARGELRSRATVVSPGALQPGAKHST